MLYNKVICITNHSNISFLTCYVTYYMTRWNSLLQACYDSGINQYAGHKFEEQIFWEDVCNYLKAVPLDKFCFHTMLEYVIISLWGNIIFSLRKFLEHLRGSNRNSFEKYIMKKIKFSNKTWGRHPLLMVSSTNLTCEWNLVKHIQNFVVGTKVIYTTLWCYWDKRYARFAEDSILTRLPARERSSLKGDIRNF